jgi:LPS O-antigen subunit length determinant protein (WzzB/FepE family)
MREKIVEDEVGTILSDRDASVSALGKKLWNRRYVILGVVALITVLSAASIFILKPQYQSQADLRIGQISIMGQANKLEETQVLVSRLKAKYTLEPSLPSAQRKPRLVSVSSARDANVLLITQADSAESAQLYLQSIVSEIIKEHKEIFDNGFSLSEFNLKILEDALAQATSESLATNARISENKEISTLQALLGLQSRSQLLTNELWFRERIEKTKLDLFPTHSFKTTVWREPTLQVVPVFPNKMLIITLGACLGLLMGVFLAIIIPSSKTATRSTGTSDTTSH